MERLFVVLGSVLMFIGVGAGAFGAHGLTSYFEQYPEMSDTYGTAVQYLMIHGLALFAVAWVTSEWPGRFANWAGILFLLGVILFSGSLFLLVLSHVRWMGAITPLGGAALLAGWLCLALAAWRN